MSFDSGFNTGANIMDKAIDNSRSDQRYKDAAPDREVDLALKNKRLAGLKADMDFESQARQRDAKNLMEADDAYSKFETEAGALDWSKPEALNSYRQIQQRHLPSIVKNDSIRKKYEALNTVTQQTANYTDQQTSQTDAALLRRKMGDLGLTVEGASIGAALKAGQITILDANAQMQSAIKKAQDEHEDKVQKWLIERVTAPVKERNAGAAGRPGLTAEDHVNLARVKALQGRIGSMDRLFYSPNTSSADKTQIKAQRDELQKEMEGLTAPKAAAPVAPPTPGTIEMGRKFIGGNAGDPANWLPVTEGKISAPAGYADPADRDAQPDDFSTPDAP